MTNTRTLHVCLDCYLAVENQGNDPDEYDERTPEQRQQAANTLRGGHWATGDEVGFSWHACECCGSALGGTRYEIFNIKRED